MYQGWRLKINGVEFPNTYMSRGSYRCIEERRVIEIWRDANSVTHEVYAEKSKCIISFNIKEHDSQEHSAIMLFLTEKDNVLVTYYSDREDRYKEMNCKIGDLQFSHKNAVGNRIDYAETAVTLTEY